MKTGFRFPAATIAWTAAAVLAGSLTGCSGSEEPDRRATAPPSAEPTAAASEPPAPELPGTAPPPGPAPAPSPSDSVPAPAPSSPTSAETPPPNSRTTSVDNPASISVVVNKQRPLSPVDFVPPDLVQAPVRLATSGENALLRAEAAAAVGTMFEAAAAEGISLTMLSGYRSYSTQASTYNNWVAVKGSVAAADTASARPGYSEHQTGLAIDIGAADGTCTLQYCFLEQPAGAWAAENAHEFGYIVRYKLDHHFTTGFYAEPWHLRYVGVEAATEMVSQGVQTLEEYFGLPAAPSYG